MSLPRCSTPVLASGTLTAHQPFRDEGPDMARRDHQTVTMTTSAPLPAAIAHRRGVIHAVDRHKKAERRRVRKQEDRAWRLEVAAD